MTTLQDLDTPAAHVDTRRMQVNIDRMQQRMNALGVSFRPHVKTSKCLAVVQRQMAAGARGITVSTLKRGRTVLRRRHPGHPLCRRHHSRQAAPSAGAATPGV